MSANGTVPVYFTFGVFDYMVCGFFMMSATAIGMYFGVVGETGETTDEYLLGGRHMQTLPIAISLVASQLSGITMMSLPAEMYAFGITYSFYIVAILVCVPVLYFIVVPVLYISNISNCYEYLEKRFNRRTRSLVTAIYIITAFLMMPVYIFVPSLGFSQVTGANVYVVNGIVCLICAWYTLLGGIKAVVWTDVFQGVNMLGSVLLVGIMGSNRVGGIGKVLSTAADGGRLQPNTQFDLTTRATVWNTFTGGIVLWTAYVGCNQSCVQRIVALPELQNARNAMIIFGIGFAMIFGTNCLIGIIVYAKYYDCDPVQTGAVEKADKIMPYFVQDIVGHLTGVPGIFISAVFSAALSTVSANLNSVSGIIYFDFIKPFINHTERKATLIMRITVFVSGFYCFLSGFIVGKSKSIIQLISTVNSISYGVIFGIFTLGMLIPKAHGNAGFYGVLFGLTVVISMIIGAQYRMNAGLLVYKPLPTRIDGCDTYNGTMPKQIFVDPYGLYRNYERTADPGQHDSSIFDMSFHWYKLLGAICVWVLAIPLSYIIPPETDEPLDPKLFTPIIQRYVSG